MRKEMSDQITDKGVRKLINHEIKKHPINPVANEVYNLIYDITILKRRLTTSYYVDINEEWRAYVKFRKTLTRLNEITKTWPQSIPS